MISFLCQEKLHERAKNNMPVFEDYKYIRNVSDTSTMGKDEDCIKKLVSIFFSVFFFFFPLSLLRPDFDTLRDPRLSLQDIFFIVILNPN